MSLHPSLQISFLFGGVTRLIFFCCLSPSSEARFPIFWGVGAASHLFILFFLLHFLFSPPCPPLLPLLERKESTPLLPSFPPPTHTHTHKHTHPPFSFKSQLKYLGT
ncbi:hypothetical protein F4778DRAFT_736724 [Xylariomycetidae sp. FL2044]|nr:hypothetical protein F4778DRAFT_736724 [Xylariomycetidae sp. FL2044]